MTWGAEGSFLRYLGQREGGMFAARAVGTILARNAAWFAGTASGLADLPGMLR